MTGNGRMREQSFWGVALLLVVSVAVVYWQSRSFAFVNYDDPVYVTGNSHVLGGMTLDGVKWAFTTTHDANWFPLTWLSHMLTVQLFGLNPGAHHLVNVFLHAVNTFLLLMVLFRMTGALWRSALVAALFALHPLHVESVAWVAERKDVLSAFFWLLTMYAYCRYAEQPGTGRYLPVLLLFGLGLMAKPMLVTLPCVLLLLDYWPLRRLTPDGGNLPVSGRSFGRLLLEKVPLFLLAAASSIVTLIAQQQGGAVNTLADSSFLFNVGNAVVSYARYLGMMFWPKGLAVFYPFQDLGGGVIAGAALLLTFLTAGVMWQGRSHPYLPVGWLWYLGTMVPVIGLVRVGAQSMADRYTYLPLIGLFVAVAWGLGELAERFPRNGGLVSYGSVACLGVLAFVSWVQLGHWRNDFTLYRHALAVTEHNWVAHGNLANALLNDPVRNGMPALPGLPAGMPGIPDLQEARFQEAYDHLTELLRFRPGRASDYNNLGAIHQRRGEWSLAIEAYKKGLAADPSLPVIRYNLGLAYFKSGDRAHALEQCRELERLDPDLAQRLQSLVIGNGALR
jgi:protein O-mannosyl-transferase